MKGPLQCRGCKSLKWIKRIVQIREGNMCSKYTVRVTASTSVVTVHITLSVYGIGDEEDYKHLNT